MAEHVWWKCRSPLSSAVVATCFSNSIINLLAVKDTGARMEQKELKDKFESLAVKVCHIIIVQYYTVLSCREIILHICVFTCTHIYIWPATTLKLLWLMKFKGVKALDKIGGHRFLSVIPLIMNESHIPFGQCNTLLWCTVFCFRQLMSTTSKTKPVP